ncbi:hypothetical protein DFJ58DRAFT_743669 [Suillus subalutaceus]|uniref:uncharacterized protein n=1 Tax=Suillus subalutaceus TaxID=48586 RepID=UPI001B861AAC|nr:uncharacterized protein DFJ58DRAFT_743669 [Suillus subalutaceus]KAG1864242.1 hypothetical protein DFJ58DRAFT_743669 [Suillus subalutaceus]
MAARELNLHIREKHNLARDFQALYARNSGYHGGPHRPAASPQSSTGNLTSTPSESTNTLSTESDLTLSTISSTRFSVWLQQNPVRPRAPTTIDDIALSRNHRTDSPKISTQHLRNSVRFQVQDLVDEFEGVDAAARQACIKGMRCMPIFPALYAHVFTHLNVCPRQAEMRRDWLSRDNMWCLINFKAIKDALSGLMNQAQVELHVCNQSLTGQSRLHALDIQDIGALIASCSTDPHATSQLITLKDDKGHRTSPLSLPLAVSSFLRFDSAIVRSVVPIVRVDLDGISGCIIGSFDPWVLNSVFRIRTMV